MFLLLNLITLSISILSKHSRALASLLIGLGLFCSTSQAAQHEWVLSGTIVDDTNSQAMFINEYGTELLLTTGEVIQDCQLIDVLKKSAKLRCNEKMRTLLLRGSVGDINYNATQGNTEVKQQMITLHKDELTSFMSERQRVVSEIGFLPLLEEEKVIGFTVSKVRPNTTVSALGLFNGDVIKTVNGVSASDTGLFLHTLSELTDVSEVSVEVDRDGQRYAYTYILE